MAMRWKASASILTKVPPEIYLGLEENFQLASHLFQASFLSHMGIADRFRVLESLQQSIRIRFLDHRF